jgi:purine-cytosine permease-like protein
MQDSTGGIDAKRFSRADTSALPTAVAHFAVNMWSENTVPKRGSAIEGFGTGRRNPSGRSFSSTIMGVPCIILGGSLGTGYGWNRAILIIAIGCALTGTIASLAAYAGVRSRRTAALLAKQTFGTQGAALLGTYALAALATRQTLPTEILSALGFPAVIGLLLPVGLLQNGIVCLYSSSLASSQLAPRAPIRRMTMLLAIVCGALALIGVNEWFVSFLVILGTVFAPAVALLILTGILTSDQRHVDRDWSLPHLATWLLGIGTGIMSEVGGSASRASRRWTVSPCPPWLD